MTARPASSRSGAHRRSRYHRGPCRSCAPSRRDDRRPAAGRRARRGDRRAGGRSRVRASGPNGWQRRRRPPRSSSSGSPSATSTPRAGAACRPDLLTDAPGPPRRRSRDRRHRRADGRRRAGAHPRSRRRSAPGRPVVTANKHVIAHHGPELEATARRTGAALRFEAAVGGGIPVLGPLAAELAGNRVTAVRGIVNGTTNYILTRDGRGGPRLRRGPRRRPGSRLRGGRSGRRRRGPRRGQQARDPRPPRVRRLDRPGRRVDDRAGRRPGQRPARDHRRHVAGRRRGRGRTGWSIKLSRSAERSRRRVDGLRRRRRSSRRTRRSGGPTA